MHNVRILYCAQDFTQFVKQSVGLMDSQFVNGAYAASAVSVVLAVYYVKRILETPKDDPTNDRKYISIDGELLPSPNIGGGPNGPWPKEYAVFCLVGCFFGTASFLTASTYF
jgi:hypothetical protein